jgi:membrane protease YdiL (CAAX protease family)
MLHSLPDPQPEIRDIEPRNRWAVVDLIVFGVFFLVLLVLVAPFSGLPVLYAIPLQGLFNITLVGFVAAWIRIVRRSSFKEYIHFFSNHTFSTKSLMALGVTCAISVLIVSQFLPSTDKTPLEKLLTTRSALLMFAVFGVAVAPMLEEIIFRGFLFKALWEIGGTRFAMIVTAFLFALLHAGQLAGNWGGVALIFAVGCILSIVRERSNSIIPSFVVHTSYNSTLFALFAFSSILEKIGK